MENQLDTQALVRRAQLVARELRKSELFPALLGGVAGGIAGALMAALVAGRLAAPRASATARENAAPKFAWSLREVVQLATVVAALLKQIQAWTKERGR